MKKQATPKPKCPKCSGTRLRIIENPKFGLFVFCQTRGCFTFPVNTSAARPGLMSYEVRKVHMELSIAQTQELRALNQAKGPIEAIKRLRVITGCGLKEAHQYVSRYLFEENPQ